jgi:hypothetical protein
VDESTMATTAAPSLIPHELPAVTVPSARCSGRSRASRSRVIPARGRSSTSTPPTATSSAAKPPACWVVQAAAWDLAA